MKKRILALALAALMVISAAGCGNSGTTNGGTGDSGNGGNGGGTNTDNPSTPNVNTEISINDAVINATTGVGEIAGREVTKDKITLTFWHYEDETTASLMADAFMAKYPNITVECRLIEDMSTDLSAAASAGNFPDVFEGTDSDTALANQYWLDISEYFNADPENDNLFPTIKEYGIGCFDTNARFAVPMMVWPSAVFIDRNVIEKLNLQMPRTDWTWAEMIDLIKKATVDDRTGMKYYGLGYYNRLDSLYGIAACTNAERAIKGEFGFNGEDFDLQYWAIGEQQFSDLKLGGYVAPQQDSQAMEDWSGDWSTWFGATGHVAVFSEAFWTYQNLWGVEGYQDQYGLDIIPYVTPNVVDEKEHNVITNMYMGGVSTSCKHPYEAYLLLKFMGWGVDGLGVAQSIGAVAEIIILLGILQRRAKGDLLDKAFWRAFIRMLIATAVTGCVAFSMTKFIPLMATDNSLVITIPKFLLISVVSLIAYLVASYFLDLKESKPIFEFVKKKLFKNVK